MKALKRAFGERAENKFIFNAKKIHFFMNSFGISSVLLNVPFVKEFLLFCILLLWFVINGSIFVRSVLKIRCWHFLCDLGCVDKC